MRRRTFEEMITYFNQTVSEMDIDRKYKMTLLGIVTALLQKHDEELAKNSPKVNSDSGELISRQAAIDHLKKRLYETALNNMSGDDELYSEIADNRIHVWVNEIPSAQPDKDMIHLQKEQAYMQGWEEGRNALREEIWENERDRLD